MSHSFGRRLICLKILSIHYLRFLTSKAFVLSLCIAIPASAQLINVADDTSAPIPNAGHDYIHMLDETVNPANGSVSLRIQMPTPTGRGLNFPFAATYDSGKVHHFVSSLTGYGDWVGDFSASTGGWGNTIPLLSYQTWNISIPDAEGAASGSFCYYASGYMFQDSAGAQHALGLAVVDNEAPNNGSNSNCQTLAQTTKSRYGAATTALSYEGDVIASYPLSDCGAVPGSHSQCNYATPPVTITDVNGNVFTFNHQGNSVALPSTGSTAYYRPNSIEDRNGNMITIADPTSYSPTVTDTLGHSVVAFGSSSATYYSNIAPSYTVGGLVYNVGYTTTAANYTVPTVQIGSVRSEDIACAIGTNVSESPSEGQPQPQAVVQKITLPNKQKYSFFYGDDNPNPNYSNPYGLISEVDYPDGGWVRYTWKMSDTYAELATFDAAVVNGPPNGAGDLNQCNYQYKIPVVATRTIGYSTGSTPAQTQTFTYGTVWNSNGLGWTTKSTKIVTEDNITGKSATTVYQYVDCNCSPHEAPDFPYTSASQIPVEQSVTYYDWGASASFRTSTKAWTDTSYLNCQFDTLPTQQSTGHFYTYSYGLLSDDKKYDYGQLSSSVCAGSSSAAPTSPIPAREVLTPVESFINSLGATFGKTQNAMIYDHGSLIAETDYGYDAGTSLFGVSATNHDTTFTANVVANRGNLTSITKKCLTGCATDATTTFTYDLTGQIHTETDPCGNAACPDMTGTAHTTTFSYTDSPAGASGNSNAYLTQILHPALNGLSIQETYTYNYSTGELASSEDVNNSQTTSYKYGTQASVCSSADTLNRLTEIDYPDGGITEYCYTDSVPSIETATLMGGSVWKTSVDTLDGLGHVLSTSLTSDPAGADTIVNTYDGEGRLFTQTNPQRSATGGTTTFTYDALGRKTVQQQADLYYIYLCYDGVASGGNKNCSANESALTSGTWVDETDEAGRHWQRLSDAFGNLTAVIEPNPLTNALALETDYTYNALDNLTLVAQWGGPHGTTGAEDRSFTYDSLQRLVTSSNPETGTICYGIWLTTSGSSPTCQDGYDANSNLVSKTDARSVTTTYSYDALNRVISKTYSAGAGTPASCYQYDASSLVTGSVGNLVGRLSNSWTQTQACPPASSPPTFPSNSNILSRNSILAYDGMGRVKSEQQCTRANCGTSSSYTPAYMYDLAGNILTHSSGIASGPFALIFTNGYDAAGHLCSVFNGTTSLFATPEYVPGSGCTTANPTMPGYSPAGGLMNATFGAGLQLSRSYDNRLRIASESDTGNAVSNPTPGTATIVISGTDQPH